jgi:hypothetical protein
MTSTPARTRALLISSVVVAVGAVLALVWVFLGRPAETGVEPTSAATETATEPSPEPTPTPTPTPEGPSSIIGLTAAGDLVELDPANGATLRTVATDAAWAGPLSLTPDRTAVYLTRQTDAVPGRPDIVRVSLTDGTSEVVAKGRVPSLSPDGTRLAYVGVHPTNPDEEYRALHVLDLASGEVTYVPDNTCGGCARRIDQPAWSPDGSRLYVAAGFQDSPLPSMDLLVVVPGTTVDLDTAEVFQTNDTFVHREPGNPGFLSDGRLVVVSVVDFGTGDSADGMTSHQGAIETYEPTTPASANLWQFPQLHTITLDEVATVLTADAAVAPSGTAMAVIVTDWTGPEPVGILYLWEGGDQLTTLAEGITAVAW